MKGPAVLPGTPASVPPVETERSARRIHISGCVQGVGFRPYVYTLAQTWQLTGWVRNQGGAVMMHVEGAIVHLGAFLDTLPRNLPLHARLDQLECQILPPEGYQDFSIQGSLPDQVGEAVCLPVDVPPCADCWHELLDPSSRRYRYPFTHCAQCGPRYTLIERMPYDRQHSAMAGFSMCAACAAEYHAPSDRRFHAQAQCCPDCGPSLCLHMASGQQIGSNDAALAAGIRILREGGILAVKGVGGYHLMCDAQSEAAVARLRLRKRRPHRPFALLLPVVQEDELYAMLQPLVVLEHDALALLRSPQRPIVLLPLRPESGFLPSLAPGLRHMGVMLPYSPLHALISGDFAAPMVVTSANRSGDPVLTDNLDAEDHLEGVADAILHHDRPITRPAEDSVCQRVHGRWRPIRMGRGIAPMSFSLPYTLDEPVLAIGADLKNTLTLAWGNRLVMSPHQGDLGSLRSETAFGQRISDFCDLHGVRPGRLVCDAHPAYLSRRWALQSGLPVTTVLHHHAHAAAVYGEFQCEQSILVLTWDGTGYGEDGALWGGEALLGRPGNWLRFASLRPLRLIGGERAVRESWRCALSMCLDTASPAPFKMADMDLAVWAWQNAVNSPLTSSVGRLFDGAAALLGIDGCQSYEGQAAMQLEALCQGALDHGASPSLPLQWNGELWEADWRPLVFWLLDERCSRAQRALDFHASLAMLVESMALAAREQHGVITVGFAGGVFQNRCLVEMAADRLARAGFTLLMPEKLPVNDASISYGQLIESLYSGRESG